MKRLNVIVNGTAYDVVVEELKDGEVVAPKATTAPAATSAPVPSAPAGEGTKITAPMPGNIWKMVVAQGQQVKKGEVLFILEAMKMENEIMAPCDGTVKSIHATQGQTVDTDALVIVMG